MPTTCIIASPVRYARVSVAEVIPSTILLNLGKVNYRKSYMKKLLPLLLITFTLCLISCNFNSDHKMKKQEKQWVYVEIVTESKTDTSDYFYYGQVNKSLIDDIDANKRQKGLFYLTNIRLWNEGLLELYEDDELQGNLMFKIEDIEEITLYKDDPIFLFEVKQLHESALKFKKRNSMK